MKIYSLCGYIPGAIGRIVEMHAVYYSRHWNFGLFFEAKIATELSAFLSRFNPSRDCFLTLCQHHQVKGSIAIDGSEADTEGAHLRWFIISPELWGQGYGNRLLKEVIQFCKKVEYKKIYLWTFEGLASARHLYEKYGFRLTEEFEGNQWGITVLEQKFVLHLE